MHLAMRQFKQLNHRCAARPRTRPWDRRRRPTSPSLCLALPSSPLVQFIDEELVWIILDRQGFKHPEALGIRKCPSCSADMRAGGTLYAARRADQSYIVEVRHHNLMRDTLAAVHSDAGVVVRSKTRKLLLKARRRSRSLGAQNLADVARQGPREQ